MRLALAATAMMVISVSTSVLGAPASHQESLRAPASVRNPASAVDIKARVVLPVCGSAQMPSCAALSAAGADASKNAALGFGSQRDGGIIFNPLSYFHAMSSSNANAERTIRQEGAKFATSSATDEDLKKRVKPIVDAAVEILKDGRTELSAEQKLLLERLRTVNFAIAQNVIGSTAANNAITRDDRLCTTDVPLGFPNAGYEDTTHTVLVCPATLNVTAKQFVHAISHELGHVVSPCMTQTTLYKVDPDQTFDGPIAECDHAFLYDANDSKVGPTNDVVSALVMSKPNFHVGRRDKLNQELEGCGILKAQSNSPIAKPSLYAKTAACLKTRYQSEYRVAEDKYVLGAMAHDHKSQAAARSEFEAQAPAICDPKTEEHFADAFEAKVMGYMASSQGWSKKDYQIAGLLWQGFTCSENEGKRYALDTYPKASVRLETILNDTETQIRLNCSAPKEDLCPLEITPEGSASAAAASTKKLNTKSVK